MTGSWAVVARPRAGEEAEEDVVDMAADEETAAQGEMDEGTAGPDKVDRGTTRHDEVDEMTAPQGATDVVVDTPVGSQQSQSRGRTRHVRVPQRGGRLRPWRPTVEHDKEDATGGQAADEALCMSLQPADVQEHCRR